MKQNEYNENLEHLEPDATDEQKDHVAQNAKKKKAFWICFGAISACLAILVGTVLAIPLFKKRKDSPVIFEPIISSETITGSIENFIVGSHVNANIYDKNKSESQPPFQKDFYNQTAYPNAFVVKARVVKNHPSVYQEFSVDSTYKPTSCRLIQMETLQTVHGENMPRYFLYLIPEEFYVDMSAYDSLLICMIQHRTENYAIKNLSENRIEAFPIPVFIDPESRPDLGCIIAFRDGVFDESLWQNEAWDYVCNYAHYYLNDPDKSKILVRREDTEEAFIRKIERNLLPLDPPSVISLQFTSEELKAAVEYVKPFQNGVFVQTSCLSYELIFTRYVNGFESDETVRFNLRTKQAFYSDVRYTPEEVADLTEMGDYLVQKAAEYTTNPPTPTHTNERGKVLKGLNLCAWYAKVDGKVYGVIKTTWRYGNPNEPNREYHDDSYILYDTAEGTMTEMERTELVKIVSWRNVSSTLYEKDVPRLR